MKGLIGLIMVMVVSSFAQATEIIYRVEQAQGREVQLANGMGFGWVTCNGLIFQGARGSYLSLYLDTQAHSRREYSSSREVRLAVSFNSERECLLAKTMFLSQFAEIVMSLDGGPFSGERPTLSLRGIEQKN